MKKLGFLIAFATIGSLTPASVNAQAAGEGDILIDVMYGFPNLFKTTLEAAYVNSGTDDEVEVTGIGPLGLHAEYMVTDGIGIGVIFNYTHTGLTYISDDFDNNGNPVTYTYEIDVPRIRIIPKIAFHYGTADEFDFYSYVAIGYNNWTLTAESDDPNFEDDQLENLIPIAFRLATGARYYFTDNLGLAMELGLGGGGVLTGGLTVKL